MRSTLYTLTLALSTVALLVFSFAQTSADEHEASRRQIKIIACGGGEMTELTADDLALGETRDVDTSCGKVVSITRTFEDEIEIAIDGEKIDIPTLVNLEDSEGDGDGTVRKRIIIRKHAGACRDGANQEGTRQEGTPQEGDDCEAQHQVHKILIGADGDDVDVDVMALISEHLDFDCEGGDEDCPANLIRVLGDHEGEGGSEQVIIIKKRIQGDGDDEESDGEE